MSLGIDYQDSAYRFSSQTAARYQNYGNYAASPYANDEEALLQMKNQAGDAYVSAQGNTCTDGVDDGKISFFSKAINLVQGIGKQALNMVKGAIQHPFKTALMIGACCIPVVGPFIAGGLACYGIYQGGKQIVQGIEVANSATTDAEAKDAWENIGGGALTVGASAVALKGSAGMMKSQLTGGSTTVNALRAAKASGKTAGELAEIAVREGITETASNIAGVAESAIQKGQRVVDKARQYRDAARAGDLRGQIASDVETLATRAGERVHQAADRASEFRDRWSKEGRAQAKAEAQQAKADLENFKTVKQQEGGVIQKETSKGFEVKYEADGIIEKYNSDGQLLEQTTVTTNGNTSTTKTVRYDEFGNEVSTTNSVQTVNGKGKVTDGYTETYYNETGVTSTKTTTNGKTTQSSHTSGNAETYTGVRTVQRLVDGKMTKVTEYYENGNLIEHPTTFQRARIEAASTNAGVNTINRANTIMDAEIHGVGNETIYKTGAVLLENLDEEK